MLHEISLCKPEENKFRPSLEKENFDTENSKFLDDHMKIQAEDH